MRFLIVLFVGLSWLFGPTLASAQIVNSPVTRNSLGAQPGGANLVTDYAADPTGVADATAALILFFQHGGDLYIPDGNYLIASAGPSAGGAYATITKSVNVTCGPAARFFTDTAVGVDHDFIRLSVPSDGTGLPANGVDVTWHGCLFDQSQQQSSTSIPFAVQYPPVKQGTSSTDDGLSIRGEYISGGIAYNGMGLVEVSGVTFNAGPHWQFAGGDGALFVDGASNVSLHDNKFTGTRDVSIYGSGSSNGTGTSGRIDIYNNVSTNSFSGFSIKRSINGFSIHDNACYNDVLCLYSSQLVGNGNLNGGMYNNSINQAQVEVRVDLSDNLSIHDNHGYNFGAFLADGTTIVTAYTPMGYQLTGLTHSEVNNNTSIGVNAAYAASAPEHIQLYSYDPGSGAVLSTNNRLGNNLSAGFHGPGGERIGEANFNNWEGNYEFTGAVKHITSVGLGAASSLKRHDYATGHDAYESALYMLDGTAVAPTLARFGDPRDGLYFDTATLGFATSSVSRATITSAGMNVVAGVAAANLDGILGANTPAAITGTTLSNSGAATNSAAGAASTPSLIFGGALFTGGTGTTTVPQLLMRATGTTAATTWSTSGTYLGVNAVSGFAGNFLDFHTAGGATLFRVDSAGASRSTGIVNTGGAFTHSAGTVSINNNSNAATSINTGTNNLNVTIGGTSNTTLLSSATITMPNIASSSAATTGTLCWTTGTGNINVDTTTTCLASDERLKEIRGGLSGALDMVMRLKPITYRWKDGTSKTASDPGEHIGLGAFATGYVDERLIGRDIEGNPKGWRQDAMIAALVAAVQAQQREIEALKASRR